MKTKFNGILTLLLALVVQISFAQDKTISGTVSDESGPLPGVTVLKKGTKTQGTETDFDGNYSITAKTGDVLEFSFVGMKSSSKTVGASNQMNIVLESDNLLDEIVVVGLGRTRKANELTSATQSVKKEVLTQASNPNVVQSLAGKVSGLQINTTNNGVNQTTRIVLRGNRSLTGSNEALIVIDGVISSANTLSNLSPELIESTNVIKGAGGSAIYGSQGANGVIVITTKRGNKDSKLTIDVNSSIQIEEVSFLPQRQQKYGQGWNGEHVTYENGGWGPEFDGTLQPVGLLQADGTYLMAPYSPIKDNIRQFFKTGSVIQNGVTINAGGSDSYALFSANKQNSDFVVEGDELNRTNLMFKAGKESGKWDIGGVVTYTATNTSTTSSNLFTELLQTATNIPVGQFSSPENDHHWTSYYRSPYWMRDNIRFDNASHRFNTVMNLKYQLNENVNFVFNGSIRNFKNHARSHTNGFTDLLGVGGGDNTTISNFDTSTSESTNYYVDVFANFNYELTDDLSLKATVGNNVQDNLSSFISVGGDNLTIAGFYNIDNITGQPRTRNETFRDRRFSVFASADLNYKDYLFLALTARNDWTSRLKSDRNSFFYPSAGVSFIPTNAFPSLKNGILNYAKISANVAQVGNARVGTYETNNTLNQVNGFPFGGLNSFAADRTIADPNLVNEFINSKELGLALNFFKGDRVRLDASYYITDNENLVTAVSASNTSGLTNSTVNVGETQTKGYEIDLGITAIKTQDFTWDVNFNIAGNKTIVKKVTDSADEVALQSFGAIGIFATVGEEFPLIKGTGYQRDDQGRVLIDPTTGNPLKSAEFIKLGKATPDYILGLSTSLKYKGWRLAGVFDYRTGHQFWSGTKDWLSWSGHLIESAENGRRGFIFPNSAIETAPGVYEANTSTITGGTTYSNYLNYFSNEYRSVTENFVLDATAFKVRELSLSYNFNRETLDQLGIKSLRLGVNARNPFVVLPKENRGYADPEFSRSSGNDQGLSVTGQYPATRTYGMSVNLTF